MRYHSIYKSSSSAPQARAEIDLNKVGNAYYYKGEKVTLDGSPEDNEFTIQTTIEYGSYEFKNLNFKKAE